MLLALSLLQQTDLGSGEFSGDDSYITVTEVDKDFDLFQFHHEPLPTTATSTSARNFFPAKGLLPRQKLQRACDAMDTAAHDVARDDTQISHFLGLVSPVRSTHDHCTRQASGMTCHSDVMEKPSRRWRGAVQQLADFV